MGKENNLWGGRFESETDREFFEFNRSFGFDARLLVADVRGSIAHCNCIEKAGMITGEEAESIRLGLDQLLKRVVADPDILADEEAEDVHSFIESKLFEIIGASALKLHAGRSRNDQVATALRIFMREAIGEVVLKVHSLQASLVGLAETNKEVILPGYTHLQKAQPVLFAHWCLAFFEMLRRDRDRLEDVRKRLNVSPLGSAALAGTSYPLDRASAAEELGFDSISRNSIDAVSDRDFCVEFASAASLIMVHLSRLAEDIVIYCSTEFGYLTLSDAVSTGSSIMPQKKNPDSMELIRGKSGRVVGGLMSLLTIQKGLPTAYNKDLQEDKEAVFDTFDTVRDCLSVAATVIDGLAVNEDKCRSAVSQGYLNATELADYLSRKGMAFRSAHEVTGRLVLLAISKGVELDGLSLKALKEYSDLIEEDVFEKLKPEAAIEARSVYGGTSATRVRSQLEEAVAYLEVEQPD
ncbi:MAG: argininosuccinate lyase [Acidobacteria bacterium]|nr:MAG: argininosuccinate lyase [Acidobacteriota bacterium]REK04031.1 MAG: argininosuccinate lyase [Acidobacteriota bacterium]REK15193.1 MAG: argininosuccinate lyase [Acidobacteriota bacterium]REK46283.1 MAG: argininosuccinate lyase [Acidobacteriota bacterium]